MLRFLIALASFAHADIDAQWQSWLEAPPAAAVAAAYTLAQRADRVVATLPHDGLALGGDLDVVVSGGGDLDGYYMGVSMVLARLARRSSPAFTLHRTAGVSAGGMMPFELALKGEEVTLRTHLAYGMIEEAYPAIFASGVKALFEHDHHWRMLSHYQAAKWNSSLHTLDGRVILGLSCLDPLPKLVKVSRYISVEQAAAAFIATGTYAQTYDGMACSDGGTTSGDKMTPLFQDGVRAQLIVDLMQTGFPISMGLLGQFNVSQYTRLVELGQDEAAAFAQTGTAPRPGEALSLCPAGAKVSSNVCETAAATGVAQGTAESIVYV